MGPLLLAIVLAGVRVAVAEEPDSARAAAMRQLEELSPTFTKTISFTGRFAPDGGIATIEIDESSGYSAPRPVARILTDECRTKPLELDFDVLERPLAVLDLDADGRDEIIFHSGGNTIELAVVARLDGCRLIALAKSDTPNDPELPYFGRSNFDLDGGNGISCRRTADGSVEILVTGHSAWTELDMAVPGNPVLRSHDQVSWTRTVYVAHGNQLVLTSKAEGTTKIHDDPSVPLLNRFECFGSVDPSP